MLIYSQRTGRNYPRGQTNEVKGEKCSNVRQTHKREPARDEIDYVVYRL